MTLPIPCLWVYLCILVSFFLMRSLFAEEDKQEGEVIFHIEECSSGIDYPTKGDEWLKVTRGKFDYHLHISHPQVIDGPHFSVPFFWVSPKGKFRDFEWNSLVSTKPHVGGVSWHSACNEAYFFSEDLNGGEVGFRGFFLVDGQDNMDWGASGLLFVYDGKVSTVWRWEYARDPKKKKGVYSFHQSGNEEVKPPEDMMKRISPVFKHAETEAEAWPGP